MSTKKKKSRGKPQGHFCKVCGEHKANEKFSGKGHAAHICKKCAGLSPAERSEMQTLRKIEGMAFRYLSDSEIKWLRGKMKDDRPDVREAATEAHGMKFPRYERNMMKKGLTAFSIELYIHDSIYSDWGDEVEVHARVFAEDDGQLRYIDYDAPEGEREKEIAVEPKEAKRFLKSVIHEYDALFWDEDYRDEADEYDPFVENDTAPEIDLGLESEPEFLEDREPLWSLNLELNNGQYKEMLFYSQPPDAAAELFWSLMEYFEPDDDDFDADEFDS